MNNDNAPSGRTTRQRAACDRCHALKNRCVRSSSHDHQCERCQRLVLDCTYSTKSRMGRPKGRDKCQGSQWKPALADDGSPSNHEELPSSRQSPNRNPNQLHELAPSGTTLDCSLQKLNERDIDYNANMDLDLTGGSDTIDWQFDTLEFEDRSLLAFDACRERFMDLGNTLCSPLESEFRQQKATERHAQRDLNICENLSITQQLLQLQTTLQMLSSANSAAELVQNPSTNTQHPTFDPSSLSEILVATAELTKIVKYLSVSSARPGLASEGTGRSSNNDEDPLVMLHVLTCYGYLLRLLEPIVQNNDASTPPRYETTPSLSLGIFSLASQPELNARVTTTLIREMITSLHKNLGPQVTNLQAQHRHSLGLNSLADDSPCGDLGCEEKDASSMINAAFLVIRCLRIKEEQLLVQLQTQ